MTASGSLRRRGHHPSGSGPADRPRPSRSNLEMAADLIGWRGGGLKRGPPGHHAADRPRRHRRPVPGDGAEPVESATCRAAARAAPWPDDLWISACERATHVRGCLENRVGFFALVWACPGRRVPLHAGADTADRRGGAPSLGLRRPRRCCTRPGPDPWSSRRARARRGHRIGPRSWRRLRCRVGAPLYERVEGVAPLPRRGRTGRHVRACGAARRSRSRSCPGDQLLGCGPAPCHLVYRRPLYHSAPSRSWCRWAGSVRRRSSPRPFDPGAVGRRSSEHRVTHSQWVPTMFVRLLRLDEAERQATTCRPHTFAPSTEPTARSRSGGVLDWVGPDHPREFSPGPRAPAPA